MNNPAIPALMNPTAQAVSESLVRAASEGAWRQYDGPRLAKLRTVLSETLGRKHVRLCCSGTFAVELAIRSLQLPADAEVLLAGYDFPGNFRAIQDAGATVCLCEVEANSWVPTVESLEQTVGPNTKAIVVSHLHGALASMSAICQWAKQSGLIVIEDACQVHGASVDGKPAGSWGDIGVFSFGGSKLIAAGRGGAVVTNNERFAQRMTVFCERGNDSFALSELQAAAILPQYTHLQSDHAHRLAAAMEFRDSVSRFAWLSPGSHATYPDVQAAFYKFGIQVQPSILEYSRVQQFVNNYAGREESPLSLARDWVLRSLADHQNAIGLPIDLGTGFKSFVRRSASRCRKPVPLVNCQMVADSTLVLHHSHLLDPSTGETTIDRILSAFDLIHAEILR